MIDLDLDLELELELDLDLDLDLKPDPDLGPDPRHSMPRSRRSSIRSAASVAGYTGDVNDDDSAALMTSADLIENAPLGERAALYDAAVRDLEQRLDAADAPPGPRPA